MRTLIFAITVGAFSALASLVVPHNLAQRASASDRVARIRVIDQEVVENREKGMVPLKTKTRLEIVADYKGSGPRVVTVIQIGGKKGLESIEIPGDAQFKAGEEAVVFLRCRSAVDRCHLVALGEGKLSFFGEKIRARDLLSGEWKDYSIPEFSKAIAP